MPRQPRKLHYLKCNRCRADRQKCTPTERPWPGPKCDRCIKFNYPCSASVTARGDLGKSSNVSQTSQGQPDLLDFNIEDFNNGVGHAGAQSDQFDFNAIWNLFDTGNSSQSFPPVWPTDGPFLDETWNQFDTSNASQSFPAEPPSEPPFAENLSRDQARPGCAKFFIMLQHAVWGPTNSRPAHGLHPVALGVYAAIMIDNLHITRELYHRLRQRELLVKTSRELEVKIKQEIAKGMSRDKAVKVITTDTIADASKELPENDERLAGMKYFMERLSPVQHVMVFSRILRDGERWRELVDAVGAREILLLDANHPKCHRKYGRMEDYSEIGEVVTLECYPKRCPSLSVERIISLGTDEVFAKLKETLSAPELQLELTCQRLSGLVTLIYRLFQRDQEDPVAKWFSSPAYHLTQGPFKDELSDLDSFLISEIPRRIDNVFGPDRFPLPSEWSDDESTGDEDGNDGDDGDGDDDDDNDGPFRNDVLGNNEGQNNVDFGEDFCIHFGSTNPFASL